MTTGWQTITLEKACDFINGLWKGEQPPFINVGVIRNTNFTKEGILDFSDVAYLDVEEKKFGKRQLQQGDIILEKSGGGPKQPVGRVVLFDTESGNYSFSNFTSALRIRDPKLIDYRYLHKFLYWIYASGITEGMQTHSTGIRNLNFDQYKKIEVSFPPLPEQQRIVRVLDEAFAGIAVARANAEKNLQNAREVFESYLGNLFSVPEKDWIKTTIGEHIRFIDYRGHTPEKKDSGMRLITAKNVKMGYLQESPMEFVSPDIYKTWMTRGIPKKGDVLFTTEAPLANIAQLDTDEKVVFAQRIIIMQPDPRILNSTFLKYLLLSRPIQQRIHAKGTGATVKGIKARFLKTVEIEFPKQLTQQWGIVEKLESLSKEINLLESSYRNKCNRLDELKQSLLHQAFSGEL